MDKQKLKRLFRKKGRRFKKANKSDMYEDIASYLNTEQLFLFCLCELYSTEWSRIREQ